MKLTCIVLSAIVVSALIINCSSDSTGPPGGDPPDPGGSAGLIYDYETEPANAVSQVVSAASGGSVTATGANGVTYALDVPAGAVSQNTTITVTPVHGLSVVTADGTLRHDSDCLQGALFEPDGIEFKEPLTLTITYPPVGVTCSLADGMQVVLFEDGTAYYEAIPTSVDKTGGTLTCEITHFSGYAGEDMGDYEFLKYLIEEVSQAGQQSPGWDVLMKLVSYWNTAILNGWDDLATLAHNGCHPILDALADQAIAASVRDPGESILQLMHKYAEQASLLDFSDIRNKLDTAQDAMVRAYAAAGNAKCSEGDQTTGKAMLQKAREWAMVGFVIDADPFITQVDQWLDDCGAINISLASNKSVVYNATVDAGAMDNCLVTFTVFVTGADGEALADKSVIIYRADYPQPIEGTTDANGEFSGTVSGSYVLSVHGCLGQKQVEYYARVHHAGEWNQSTSVFVTFKRLRIFTSISYEHSYAAAQDETFANCTASIMGQGTGSSGCVPCECDGYLARSYTISTNYQTVTSVADENDILACRTRAYYDTPVDPGTGLTVPVLTSLEVCGIDEMFAGLTIETCRDGEPCSTGGYTMQRCLPAPGNLCQYYQVYFPSIPGNGLVFQNTGGGTFDPYLWSGSTDYGAASLAITVGAQ